MSRSFNNNKIRSKYYSKGISVERKHQNGAYRSRIRSYMKDSNKLIKDPLPLRNLVKIGWYY